LFFDEAVSASLHQVYWTIDVGIGYKDRTCVTEQYRENTQGEDENKCIHRPQIKDDI
jgi:hypothetical protein